MFGEYLRRIFRLYDFTAKKAARWEGRRAWRVLFLSLTLRQRIAAPIEAASH